MILTSAPPPSGTVSFLFTDVVGSTGLWERHPDAMRTVQAAHDRILHQAFESCGGHVFSVAGDGYGAAFATAADALDAALAVQREIAAAAWPDGVELRVRTAIHTGEAEERAGNYFGPPVNRAARLMAATRGGRLVVSGVTAGLLADRDDIELVALGPVELAGGPAMTVFGVRTGDLDWHDTPLAGAVRPPGNLPRPLTELIGEPARVLRLARRVRPGRLLTLTGPGGIGKSRMAAEIAWSSRTDSIDGAWWVELGPVDADGDPIDAIATTLSVQPQAGTSTGEAVVDWCFGRRVLLVLDNCEHLVEPVAALVTAILTACPTVAVVATSQLPLRVPGEDVAPMAGLDADAAAELFLDRVAPDAVTGGEVAAEHDAERQAIETICARLDGVPLAIELAAARARLLSPTELLERLDDRLRLLGGGGRGTPGRHGSLRATVEWSYALLGEGDRTLFDRLSVFSGSFDLEAAAVVVTPAGEEPDEYAVIDGLGRLVDQSMVTTTRTGGTTRFRILETLRQFGAERLADRGAADELRDRHLRHYLGVAERAHELWFGPDQSSADRCFETEWDDLRAAHRWALSTDRLGEAQAIVAASAWHGLERLRYEHRTWARDSLSLAAPRDDTHPTTYAVLSAWAYFAAELDRTVELAAEGRDRHPDHPDVAGCLAWSLYGLLGADREQEARDVVRALTDELDRPLAVEVEFMARMALADASLRDRDERAADGFVALCRRIGSPVALARAAQLRANRRLAADPPDVAGALADYRRALDVGGSDAPSERLWSLGGIATCLVMAGDPETPEALRAAIEASYDARLWFELDLVLGTCASYLLDRSPVDAATILGHVSPRPPSAIGATTEARRSAIAEVASWDRGHEWLAAGAATDRHAIVGIALDALDRLDPA